ncbi:MAG TPA: transketolase C-terminal domain-containing protein, partial [Acidimicrobiales bacterium]
DPVLFLEHKHLLRQPYTRDPYPDEGYVIPFGRGRLAAEGDDLTIVTWGATVQKSLQAVEQGGLSADVIDLRTLVPWDQELVAESVRKTSRVMVVHEDVRRGGFGGEIAAWIADELFWDLDAPVARVAAKDCHVAYEPTLEYAILPQVEDILDTARSLLAA